MCSTKAYPFVSKIHTIRTPHQIHIDAKTSRVWKYSSEDKSKNFPPGNTFVPYRHSVKSGLDFVTVLCTQSKNSLPILMDNNRNHQITLKKELLAIPHSVYPTVIDPNIRLETVSRWSTQF